MANGKIKRGARERAAYQIKKRKKGVTQHYRPHTIWEEIEGFERHPAGQTKGSKKKGATDMDKAISRLDREAMRKHAPKKTVRRGGGAPMNLKIGGRDVGGRKSPWRKRKILE